MWLWNSINTIVPIDTDLFLLLNKITSTNETDCDLLPKLLEQGQHLRANTLHMRVISLQP